MRVVSAPPIRGMAGQFPYDAVALLDLIAGEIGVVSTVGKIGDGPGRTTTNPSIRALKIASALCGIASIRGRSSTGRRSAKVERTRRSTDPAHPRSCFF